jgi:hypothetical protein
MQRFKRGSQSSRSILKSISAEILIFLVRGDSWSQALSDLPDRIALLFPISAAPEIQRLIDVFTALVNFIDRRDQRVGRYAECIQAKTLRAD